MESIYIINDFLHRLKNPKSKKDYKRDIICFLDFVQKDNFEHITLQDCKDYIDYVITLVNENKLALTTAEKFYSQLYSFFNYLVQREYIDYNHFKNIRKIKATRKISKDRIISWEDLDKLITVLRGYNPRDYAISLLIFTSGLTLKEAVELKWNQFVLDSRNNVGIKFSTPKGDRFVKVKNDVWQLLLDYKSNLDYAISKDSYVFLNKKGSKISDRWIRIILEKACKDAGLSRTYSPRDLRHALAAHALKRGASSEQVKDQLGWSNSSLAERYLYTIQELDNNAIDFINFKLK
ncbi:MAG: tyrosine-type recombinase/integrase [Anaeromicrobium sp.]|jgi:site-specific recombinase XerD|uniref:tyrosine-type recombinase/integrase n=1 Tax=Anaeromicrobium sp. TaxID=1929132 RepID=UPI0025F81CFE|nr:tyrosine-type recombinase/integrase [Anaeromicrobium sp.]MCT4596193.1 tyrosine-type recombinase/integrase [Anaeromicrobium sp.]